MFSPLSLRLCCMVMMAPALTEAASTHIKQQPSTSPTRTDPSIDGVDCQDPVVKELDQRSGRPFSRSELKKPTILSVNARLLLQKKISQVGSGSLPSVKLASNLLTPGLQTRLSSLSDLFPNSSNSRFVIKDSQSQTETSLQQLDSKEKMNSPTTTNVPNGDSSTLEADTTKWTNNKLKGHIGNLSTGSFNSLTSKTNCTHNDNRSDKNATDQVPTSSAQSSTSGSNPGDIVSSADQLRSTNGASGGRTVPDCKVKDPDPVDSHVQMKKQQHHLEKRAERLVKRIRRLQSHQTVTHVQAQLSGFVDNQHKNLECMAKAIKVPPSNTDIQSELLINEDVKNLSTAALVNLVRRLQSQQVTLRQRLTNSHHNENKGVVKLDEDTCIETSRVSSNLSTRLTHLESGLDSDATDESSGGESCDEDDLYEFDKRPSVQLHRRAEWKWAVDRASVASRWTWLQAQVSDLEYRIRQQSDIYRQIRATKGSVVLGDPPAPEDLLQNKPKPNKKLTPLEAKIANIERRNEMSPCNISTLLSNVDKQSTKLTQSLGNVYSPIQNKRNSQTTSGKHLNGVIGPGSSSSDGNISHSMNPPVMVMGDASPCVDNTCQAARCRPVRSYRKRKLLRTSGLHQLSRKAARPSTVKCQCYPPTTPCAMCGGRYNNTQSLDPDNMTRSERVALLDPSFHPVLSFNQDIPLTVHFEALLRTGEWQNKPPPRTTLEKRKHSDTLDATSKKYIKKYGKSTAAALLNASSKLQNKYGEPRLSKSGSSLPSIGPKHSASDSRICRADVKKRKAARLAMAALTKKERRMSLSERLRRHVATPSPGPRDTPPLTQSCPSQTLRDMKEALLKKRRIENAYDINNIVIPYSMAASSRVEKLQYKEIITPKWREVNLNGSGEIVISPEVTNGPRIPNGPKIEPEPMAEVESKESNDSTDGINAPEADLAIASSSCHPEEESETMEDLSDEAFARSHLTCEIQEKKRFISFLTTPSGRGRGGQARAESQRSRTESGTTTPDPMSPAEASTNDIGAIPTVHCSTSFTSSTASPIASPLTPITPGSTSRLSSLDDSTGSISRKRSGSLSMLKRERTLSSMSEDPSRSTSATPIMEHQFPPWETGKFPMTEKDLDQYLVASPPPQFQPVITTSVMTTRSNHHYSYDMTPVTSRACSPDFLMSPESEDIMFEDDSQDPEWAQWKVQNKTPTGLVLKLAKR